MDFTRPQKLLGRYLKEENAAQNRDYYIVKNNKLNRSRLNFYNIDYTNFIPYKNTDGKINKYLLN